MSTNAGQAIELPSATDFYTTVPLYRSFDFGEKQGNELLGLRYFKGHIDCYCISCQQPSVFNTDNYVRRAPDSPSLPSLVDKNNYVIKHEFSCSRNQEHQMFFFFLIHNKTITKIGQHPSLADLVTVDIQRYRRVLGNERYVEFSRAVGLTSHGIGIGAFVYLRRIFASLIEEAHQLQTAYGRWDEELYQRSRIADRIELLKSFLPEFLVQNKSLYSILSKGIHELQESECLSAFPVIKLGIELILDEQLEKLQREEKIKQTSKDIGELTKKLKSGDT